MARSIFNIIDDIANGLAELKQALGPLSNLVGRALGAREAAPAMRRAAKARPARRAVARRVVARRVAAAAALKGARPVTKARIARKVSPKLRAVRQMQGKYLGAIRHLTPQQKSQVQKAKADGGYDAALKLAASFKK